MIDVKRLKRMVELAVPGAMEAARKPEAKYLRPAQTYALPLWGGVKPREENDGD
jgi:hypothetical protein